MKIAPLTFLLLTFLVSTTLAVSGNYNVTWEGTLKAVHHGDVSGKLSLNEFSGKKHLYAVGPVAELDGEITVIDSTFHIARVRHGEIKTDNDLTTRASFLVWAEVPAWRSPVMLGESADNQDQLEKLIDRLAAEKGVDTTKPFPFMIDGIAKSADYHILAPKASNKAASDHRSNAKTVPLKDVPVRIIGFFSKNHGGIFTHMGSMTHLHILDNNGHSGHVDAIALDSKAMVLFPR
ncbi:MAG: acetolactate decarboxylase [Thermodesulfobacteriota bacterium]